MRCALLVGVLAVAGCSTLQRKAAAEHAYRELVQLRGETVTLLEERRLSVGEARWLDRGFDRVRVDLDHGNLQGARTRLSTERAYLDGRNGSWTR